MKTTILVTAVVTTALIGVIAAIATKNDDSPLKEVAFSKAEWRRAQEMHNDFLLSTFMSHAPIFPEGEVPGSIKEWRAFSDKEWSEPFGTTLRIKPFGGQEGDSRQIEYRDRKTGEIHHLFITALLGRAPVFPFADVTSCTGKNSEERLFKVMIPIVGWPEGHSPPKDDSLPADARRHYVLNIPSSWLY